ncbi:Uncharacterised protein [Nocardia farcinica]|uniref:hypothetical protein n=1 Tax=Nocardia farcinica TaxID=37329 RepID=UPI000DF89100|nr:hypothetical protein [Nocardia farcinica]SUE27746.1 Uncharacterised protein [Nocardia farcinica]
MSVVPRLRKWVTSGALSWRPRRPDPPAMAGLYRERANLLVVLASLWPAVLAYNDPRMRGCAVLYIATPCGQVSYHIVDRDLPLFFAVGVPVVRADDPRARWDGSTKGDCHHRLQRAATDLAERTLGYGYRWSDIRSGQIREAIAATHRDAGEIVAQLRARQQRYGRPPDATVIRRHAPAPRAPQAPH